MADVETANSYLVAHSTKRFYERLGIVGGLLFGGVFGAYLSMPDTTQIFSFRMIIMSLLGLIGVF